MERSAAQHADSAVRGSSQLQTTYLHATALSNIGTSQGDPRQTPSFSANWQDRPFQDAAFDRFYSLVEVCAAAGTPLTPLNSSPRYDQSSSPDIPHCPPPPESTMARAPPSDVEDEPAATSSRTVDSVDRGRRRHPCKMCNKAFDRPSTLKTHLLVHTGITPFACHLCGRRFGVQSNCNRHIRRCTLRSELFLARRLEFESQAGHPRPPTTHLNTPLPRSESSHSPSPPPPKAKRARRKRSPAPEWIPQSLAAFKRPSTHSPVPVPLPPVRPRIAQEERDSYTICHDRPYTEEGWSGRLPGPAALYDSTI